MALRPHHLLGLRHLLAVHAHLVRQPARGDLLVPQAPAGSWAAFGPILSIGHFLLPFFTLLPRANKRNLKLLGFFAGWMMLMHYCDLYWQIMPVLHTKGVAVHWMDAAAWLAVGSAYGLVFWQGLKEKPLVPVGDPRLEQCLAFHNV